MTSSAWALLCCFTLCVGSLLPSHPKVDLIHGEATQIEIAPNHLRIESGEKTVLEWDQFSIEEGGKVHFQQQDRHSAVLNRVVGQLRSDILGELTSNGKVFLINPNGILFGPNASVETTGFLASTLDILDADFLENTFLFQGESRFTLTNQGTIRCPGGEVFFVAEKIVNKGTIEAHKVGLAAGKAVLIRPSGKEQIFIHLPTEAALAQIQQGENLYAAAISHTGTMDATLFEERGGEIYLVADRGTTEVQGNLRAQGGKISLLGEEVAVLKGTMIDASGKMGGGAIFVGGDFQGKNPDVPNAKTVRVEEDTWVKADAISQGNGGRIIFWADETTSHLGQMSVRGGGLGGDGGFIEVSGKQYLMYGGLADSRAPKGNHGTLLLDPSNVTISTSADSNVTNPGAVAASAGTYTPTGVSPCNIRISNASAPFGLEQNLAVGNVVISTTSADTEAGNITVSSAISWSSSSSLTLSASGTITISAAVSAAGGSGAMSLVTTGAASGAYNGIVLGSGGSLATGSGAITISASTPGSGGTAVYGVYFNGGTVSSASGSVVVTGVVVGGSGISHGINIITTNAIQATSTITLVGTTSASGAGSYGVNITTPLSTTSNATLSIQGTGGTGSTSYGVNIGAALTNPGAVNITGSLQAGGGSYGIGLGATIATTNNSVSLNSATFLTATAAVNTGSANISFSSIIDGGQALTLTAGSSGNITLSGIIGGTTALGTFTVASANLTSIAGSITTANSNIAFNGPVRLTDTIAISSGSGAGDITFAATSTINGSSANAQDLTLTAGTGSITMSAAVGGTTALRDLTTVSCTNWTAVAITATSISQTAGTGITTFNGALTTSGDILITGTACYFNAAVTTTSSGQVRIYNTGELRIAANMTLDGGFAQTGTGSSLVASTMTTTNDTISFLRSVQLNGNSTFNAGTSGNVTFSDTVYGGFTFSVTGATVTFSSTVGVPTPITTLSVTGSLISIASNQVASSSSTMTYTGPVVLVGNTIFSDVGTISFSSTITGNYNLTITSSGSTVSVGGAINVSGAAGADGKTVSIAGSTGVTVTEVLSKGGTNATTGKNGGSVTLDSDNGSVTFNNIDTRGGDGTGGSPLGGTAGAITISPTAAVSGGLPSGIIVINQDQSGNGNLYALGGNISSGTTGTGGTVTLSANRSIATRVATIVSSVSGNDVTIKAGSLVIGNYEAMTALGNTVLQLNTTATLSDMVALEDFRLQAVTANLLTHGTFQILDNTGQLYDTPSLHFYGGVGYFNTASFDPVGPIRALDLGYALPSSFRNLLLFSSTILNYDLRAVISSRLPIEHLQSIIYRLQVAQAEFFDMFPVHKVFPPRNFTMCTEKERKKECSPQRLSDEI